MIARDELLPLASEFPPASREQWLGLVDAVLKGASFEDRLVKRTYDALAIEPLYTPDVDATPVPGRGATPWQILQRADQPHAAAANAQCLDDLANGANGLTLAFAGSIGAHGFGLPTTADAIAQVLDAVFLDAIPIELDLPVGDHSIARHVADVVIRRGIAPAAVQLRFALDPFAALALHGQEQDGAGARPTSYLKEVHGLRDAGFTGPLVVADGRVVHDAGGSEAQELAYALASAVASMRILTQTGMSLDAARDTLFFRLSADADQHLTLSKLRALRKLWARIEEASGLAHRPIFISAHTAWRMTTQRDPWVNILRTTVATAAAGMAGANAITVLPFTCAIGLPDAFARRLARNTQTILIEESHLAKVSDPAAGSGAIEDITDQLCRSAWSLFQEIERAGGLAAALEAGIVQHSVSEVRAKRRHAIAHRIDALTGTSTFPHLAELPVAVLAPLPPPLVEGRPACQASRVGIDFTATDPERPPPQPSPLQGERDASLAPIRLAEPYERLRDASDHRLTKNGKRPQVFLANLGKPADFTPRATFARNLFEAGGIEAVGTDGFSDAHNLAAVFLASGAQLACLCSSDPIYAEHAAAAAESLRKAGARAMYLAGKPGTHGAAWRAAGITSFLYEGCDVLAALQEVHDIVGVTDAAGRP